MFIDAGVAGVFERVVYKSTGKGKSENSTPVDTGADARRHSGEAGRGCFRRAPIDKVGSEDDPEGSMDHAPGPVSAGHPGRSGGGEGHAHATANARSRGRGCGGLDLGARVIEGGADDIRFVGAAGAGALARMAALSVSTVWYVPLGTYPVICTTKPRSGRPEVLDAGTGVDGVAVGTPTGVPYIGTSGVAWGIGTGTGTATAAFPPVGTAGVSVLPGLHSTRGVYIRNPCPSGRSAARFAR